mgnify:CR=1 FL=1
MFKVAVIALMKENKILLQLRDNKLDINYPGFWSLIGGQIEKNETPLSGLEREIKEEITAPVYNIDFVSEILHNQNRYCPKHVIYLFKGNISKDLEDINILEGQKLDLFSYEEFIKLRFPLQVKKFIIKNKNKFFN